MCRISSGQRKRRPKPCLFAAHDPLLNPQEFNDDVQRAVSVCNIHEHSMTCKKTKIGLNQCRLARPQQTTPETRVVQIRKTNGQNGAQSEYEIVNKIENPQINCLKGRNIMRTPCPTIDNRLLIWEIARPEFEIPENVLDHLNGIFYNANIHYRFKNTVLLTKSI